MAGVAEEVIRMSYNSSVRDLKVSYEGHSLPEKWIVWYGDNLLLCIVPQVKQDFNYPFLFLQIWIHKREERKRTKTVILKCTDII